MSTIPIGRYLWERLHQVGVDTIFGVPGDFNLDFLDFIYDVKGLRWVGNANELNGAYAADGYGRIKGVPGVIVTTHGVGELSALNGIAGAHSEQVKVIHVVGQTTRKMQKERVPIHHSISNDPDHSVYSKMSTLARVDAAELKDAETAPAEIDRVIRECFLQSRPVYIFLPLDLSQEHIPASLLNKPLDTSYPVDAKAQDEAVSAILKELTNSSNPAIYVDCLTQRHNAVPEVRALVDKLQLPVFASNMGKCLVDETHPCHVGTMNGKFSAPGVFEALSAADTVLVLGNLPGDTNTGAFTRGIGADRGVFVNPFDVDLKDKAKYANIYLKPLLAKLVDAIPADWKPKASIPTMPNVEDCPEHPAHGAGRYKALDERSITQDWVWERMAQFFRPGDVVIPDTGTSTFGLSQTPFAAKNMRFVGQTYYGSIGWSVPAALGSEIALEEMAAAATQEKAGVNDSEARGRTLLFVGDGSFGLTMQEVGTMVQQRVRPIIFLINNKGYTIERVIHGGHMTYNDINPLSYKHLLPLFQHPSPETCYRRCASRAELEAALADPELAQPTLVQVVEIVMDKLDVPWRLMEIIKSRGEAKVGELRAEGFIEPGKDEGSGGNGGTLKREGAA